MHETLAQLLQRDVTALPDKLHDVGSIGLDLQPSRFSKAKWLRDVASSLRPWCGHGGELVSAIVNEPSSRTA